MNRDQLDKVKTISNVTNVCRASCRKLKAQLERVRENLRAEWQQTFAGPEKLLRLALGEAEALAWQTGYPHLVFPTLAVEKVQAVSAWHLRQQSLAQRQPVASRPF